MTQNQLIFRFIRWAIFLFIALGISGSIERKLAVSVGCQLSPAFAQTIADGKKSADEQLVKDPEGMRRVGHQMIVARYTVRGITTFILAGMIVWWRKDSRNA
jgi:hypothetical protein